MEGLKTIITRVKPEEKLSNNDFVLGRISVFQDALLRPVNVKPGTTTTLKCRDRSTIYEAKGTDEEIARFKHLVVTNFEGLCEFFIK